MTIQKPLRVKLFADGANLKEIEEVYKRGVVSGFTTNPTLMRKAGVVDYEQFARSVLRTITDLPVSFEVFSDDFRSMEIQARKIASWGQNVYVKIPISNTMGEPSYELIKRLSNEGIKLNVTAILTATQIESVVECLSSTTPAIISVFSGRIADTGVDPIPIMLYALEVINDHDKRNIELLWASTREVFNIYQADSIGCHIITVPNDILKKMSMNGKDLAELSLETVKMFYTDAQASGFKI